MSWLGLTQQAARAGSFSSQARPHKGMSTTMLGCSLCTRMTESCSQPCMSTPHSELWGGYSCLHFLSSMGHGWQRRIPTREAGIRVTLPSLSVCGGGFLWQRTRPGGDDWWIRRCGGPRWLKHWSRRCEADPGNRNQGHIVIPIKNFGDVEVPSLTFFFFWGPTGSSWAIHGLIPVGPAWTCVAAELLACWLLCIVCSFGSRAA